MKKLTLTPVETAKSSLHVKSNEGRTYKFTLGDNPISGDLGWKPLDIKGFDAVAPVMVVHDIMEHFPDDEHDPHNEYQAQGAAFWLRHEGKYPFTIFRDVIAPAFGMLFYHIINSSLKTKLCPLVKESVTALKNKETDYLIKKTLENAKEYIANGEFSYGAGRSLIVSDKDTRTLYASLEQALGWMRIGYLRAAKRYEGLDKKKLVKLYIAVQEAVEFFLNKASDLGVNDIGILSVTINPSKQTYVVTSEISGRIK